MTDQNIVQRQPSRRRDIVAIRRKYAHIGPMVDIAYWTIRDAIRNGTLAPGDARIEMDLADELEMSRTPIREALRRLAVDRLIETGPRRGYIVPTISISEFVEIFEIRELLDGLSARLAAQRMGVAEIAVLEDVLRQHDEAIEAYNLPLIMSTSDQFHMMIRNGSKQLRVPQLLAVLTDASRSGKGRELAPDRTREAAREHRAIFEAIARRDPEAAEELARTHVRNALKAQIRAYQQSGTAEML